jgi:hypothetical protein
MATKEYGKRDPSSHRTPEQIRAMDHGYNHRPVIVKEREMRNEARARSGPRAAVAPMHHRTFVCAQSTPIAGGTRKARACRD